MINKYRMMRTRYFYIILQISILSGSISMAQEPSSDTSYWHRGFKGTLTFSQVNLSNWAAGGENSVSLNSFTNVYLNHAKGRVRWENSLDLAYGFLDQKEVGTRKTDDKIQVLTKIGYQLSAGDQKLFWSTGVGLSTQFASGFAFPNDSVSISKAFAPAYLVLSTGLEYKPSKKISLMFSPVTGKMTFVSDQRLANSGAFGVEAAEFDALGALVKEGKKFRAEIGTYLNIKFKEEVWENVNLESRLQLFSNYLENIREIDINWELTLLMKINKYLSASLTTQILYDKDVEFPKLDDVGVQVGVEDKLQFKEIIGIGFSYTFNSK